MNEIVQIVIWLTGAVGVITVLSGCLVALAYGLKVWADRAIITTLLLMRLSTARYWVNRMEKEGLTVCRKDYRKLVAERKAKTIEDFQKAEQDDIDKEVKNSP
jgi:membrane protein implicated in regulation of membrane protease activity